MNTLHRQIGRLQKRTEDKIDVALVIAEFQRIETFTEKLIANSTAWRDAWTDILVFQTHVAHSYQEIYQNAFGDSSFDCTNIPMEKLQQVSDFHGILDELRLELAQDMNQLERTVIDPLTDIKDAFKPVHKALKKRENTKLDFERYQKQVDHSKAKRNRSNRENKVLEKAERDLEVATTEYQNNDERIIEWLPTLVEKVSAALPLILSTLVTCQVEVLARSYTVLLEYAQSQGIELAQVEMIVQEWEEKFTPIQRHVETALTTIARGKAVTIPISQLSGPKLPMVQKVLPSRPKKAPPPPPPLNPPTGSKRLIGKRAPSAGPAERSFELEGNTPSLVGRPLISRASTSALRSYNREESPSPPPLPGNKPPPPVSPSSRAKSGRFLTSTEGGSRLQLGNRTVSANSILSPGGQTGGDRSEWPRLRTASSHSSLQQNSGDHISAADQDTMPSFASAKSKFSHSNNGNGSGINSAIEKSLVAQLQNARPVLRSTESSYAPSIVSIAPSTVSAVSTIAAKKKPPPPPPPKKKSLFVTALYNFEGQENGDLSFKIGDRIKVTKKTDSLEDWWEGELDGRRGEFPANYTTSHAE